MSDHYEAFAQFHAAHPQVLATMIRLADEWLERRGGQCGVEMLWNRMRWELTITGLPDSSEAFKLNNNYKPYYARLLMAVSPRYAGLFELRRSDADQYDYWDMAADYWWAQTFRSSRVVG